MKHEIMKQKYEILPKACPEVSAPFAFVTNYPVLFLEALLEGVVIVLKVDPLALLKVSLHLIISLLYVQHDMLCLVDYFGAKMLLLLCKGAIRVHNSIVNCTKLYSQRLIEWKALTL